MKGCWYIVKATAEADATKTVEFDFFGNPNSCESVALAIEIAKNKLHTTGCVSLQFNMM